MHPSIDPITYSQEDAQKVRRLRLYEPRWVPTWGAIGRRKVRRLKRAGWEHVGSIPTGLLRREHCLIKITLEDMP